MNLTRASIALAAALAGPAAFAAATAQASLSGLSFQLIDLNPTDGITPWISFAQASQSEASAAATQPLASQSSSTGAFGAFGNANAGASVPLAGAWASISGGALKTLAAGGFADGLTPELMGYGASVFSAQATGIGWNNGFTLSPFTLLVVSGQGHVATATTIGIETQFWASESANAQIYLNISGVGSDGNGAQNATDGLSAFASYQFGSDGEGNWVPMPQSFELEETATVSFLNLTAGGLEGSLSAYVAVNGNSAMPAVPEPGGAALLLSGLGLLGWFGRRHTRR